MSSCSVTVSVSLMSPAVTSSVVVSPFLSIDSTEGDIGEVALALNDDVGDIGDDSLALDDDAGDVRAVFACS